MVCVDACSTPLDVASTVRLFSVVLGALGVPWADADGSDAVSARQPQSCQSHGHGHGDDHSLGHSQVHEMFFFSRFEGYSSGCRFGL